MNCAPERSVTRAPGCSSATATEPIKIPPGLRIVPLGPDTWDGFAAHAWIMGRTARPLD